MDGLQVAGGKVDLGATKGQLNMWRTGPVLLYEMDCRTTHVAGCPLATYT